MNEIMKRRREETGHIRLKKCFHRAHNDLYAIVEKMAKSNMCILGSKSLPNMRGGGGGDSESSLIVCGMLETFTRNVKVFLIPAT